MKILPATRKMNLVQISLTDSGIRKKAKMSAQNEVNRKKIDLNEFDSGLGPILGTGGGGLTLKYGLKTSGISVSLIYEVTSLPISFFYATGALTEEVCGFTAYKPQP